MYLHCRPAHVRRGQEMTFRVDGEHGVVELESGRLFGHGQVGLKEGLNGTNVLPVTVEEVRLRLVTTLGRLGDNLASKIEIVGEFVVQ